MKNTIIYLVGHAGTGKFTIAKELCKKVEAKLVDNHYINNPVFDLLDMDGDLPDKVWDFTDRIRTVIYETMTDISPKDYNFIFTNVLYEDDPRHHKSFFNLQNVAEKREACFVPVQLNISKEALVERRTADGRAERNKDTSEENAIEEYENCEVLNFEHPNRLDVDVSEISPDETVAKILTHIKENC
mgnify:CR=1 FL=1